MRLLLKVSLSVKAPPAKAQPVKAPLVKVLLAKVLLPVKVRVKVYSLQREAPQHLEDVPSLNLAVATITKLKLQDLRWRDVRAQLLNLVVVLMVFHRVRLLSHLLFTLDIK